MTGKTLEQQVQTWQTRIQMGARRMKDMEPVWEELLNNYRNRYWINDDIESHRVSVNVAVGIISLLVPTIYFRDPHIKCHARRPGDERGCKITESILNYYIRELKLKRQVKRCIIDAAIFGVGYAKLGWEVELETDLEPVYSNDSGASTPLETESGEPVLQDSQGNVYLERDGKFIQVMDKGGELIPQSPEMPTLNEFIRREQPYAIRWSPWDIIKDPEAKYADFSDARWMAFRMVVPLEEVKANSLYKNTANLQATHELRTETRRDRPTVGPEQPDQDNERVELWEVWCKEWNRNKRRYEVYQKVIVKDHNKFLLNRPSPYLAEGFPVATLFFMEDPEDPNPIPMLTTITSQIETINMARAQQANHRERFNRRYLANENVISQLDAEKVARATDGEVVMVKAPLDYDLSRAFVAVEDAPLNAEAYGDYNLAWDEIQRTIGLTDYQQGGAGPARKATEAAYIERPAQIRMVEKQDAVGDFVEDIARYFKQLLQQFGDYEMALKITNDVGEEEWVNFKVADSIPNDMSWSVDVAPSAFESKELEQKRWADLYNLTANETMVNKAYILERLMRAYGIEEPQAALIPPQMLGMMPGQVQSVGASGGAVDVNQLREPAATDVGASGRAAS